MTTRLESIWLRIELFQKIHKIKKISPIVSERLTDRFSDNLSDLLELLIATRIYGVVKNIVGKMWF